MFKLGITSIITIIILHVIITSIFIIRGDFRITSDGIRTEDVVESMRHSETCFNTSIRCFPEVYRTKVETFCGYLDGCKTSKNYKSIFGEYCRSFKETVSCYVFKCQEGNFKFLVPIKDCLSVEQINILKYSRSVVNSRFVFIFCILSIIGLISIGGLIVLIIVVGFEKTPINSLHQQEHLLSDATGN